MFPDFKPTLATRALAGRAQGGAGRGRRVRTPSKSPELRRRHKGSPLGDRSSSQPHRRGRSPRLYGMKALSLTDPNAQRVQGRRVGSGAADASVSREPRSRRESLRPGVAASGRTGDGNAVPLSCSRRRQEGKPALGWGSPTCPFARDVCLLQLLHQTSSLWGAHGDLKRSLSNKGTGTVPSAGHHRSYTDRPRGNRKYQWSLSLWQWLNCHLK